MNARIILSASALVATILVAPRLCSAGEATLSDVHLCCGACVRALDKALGEVDGVKEVKVDQKKGQASFETDGRKALDEALKAVTLAGFFGQAQYDGRDIDLPSEPAEKDATADRATFEGVHLCCKGCAKAVTEAVKEHENVIAVDCDTKKGTVLFVGTEMQLSKLLDALHKAGFHGRLKP